MSLTIQDNPASKAQGITTTRGPLRRRNAGADLWWQRSPRAATAASAGSAERVTPDMLPTMMVGSAIILFKLFMLGLLIYSL